MYSPVFQYTCPGWKCLMVPSHHLNQCWLIISEVLWQSPVGNITGNAQDIYHWYEFENYWFKNTVTFFRDQRTSLHDIEIVSIRWFSCCYLHVMAQPLYHLFAKYSQNTRMCGRDMKCFLWIHSLIYHVLVNAAWYVMCHDKLITVTSLWAQCRLKSPASRLFTQPFFQAQIKEDIKAPRHWPLRGEFIGDRWIPRTKDQ